jgi:hypothetical protein
LTAQLDSLPTLFTARDHQLFALYLYRKFNGDTPELDRIMIRVENRIAAGAALSFRVTDLYLQRIAFLLAARRPAPHHRSGNVANSHVEVSLPGVDR